MTPRCSTLIGLVLAMSVVPSCSNPPPTGDGTADASTPGRSPDADPDAPDAGPTPETCQPNANLPRGLAWVRANPMFISGLVTQMPAPPPAAVHAYFDEFGATSAHLWQTALPDKMDAWAAAGNPNFRFIAWTLDDGTNHGHPAVLGGYGPDAPGRIGYQIGDEPRDWATLNAIDEGIGAVRDADPDALIILNFSFLADEIDAFLAHYGQNMDGDVVSYDNYTAAQGIYDTMARFRQAGLDHGMPYWAYLDSYFDDSHDAPSHSDMKWTALVHALYGYTGYSWFIYQLNAHTTSMRSVFFSRHNDWAAPTTPTFDAAAEINHELARLGRVLTQLTSTDVRYMSSISFLQPQGTQGWTPGAGGDPYLEAVDPGGQFQDLVLGFFEDDCGETYVMVQNPNHSNGDFPSDGVSPTTVTLTFDFAGAGELVDNTAVDVFNRATGAVEPYPLETTGTESTLVIQIDAGDAILYKYRTGAPWAMQAP